MDERARRLRQNIARFERLLEGCVDPDLAAAYRAEIAAARAMLEEIEGGSSTPETARFPINKLR